MPQNLGDWDRPTGYEYLFMALSGMLTTNLGSIGSFLVATSANEELKREVMASARIMVKPQTSIARVFELSSGWLRTFIESEDLARVSGPDRVLLTGMLTETYASAKLLLVLARSGANQQRITEAFEDLYKFEGAGDAIDLKVMVGQSIEMLPEYLSLLAKEFEKLYVK